jgi:hypothetical protein
MSRLNRRDLGWLHFKFSIGILWPILIWASQPLNEPSNQANPWILIIWSVSIVIGSLLSMFGIVARTSPKRKWVQRGLATELAGIILMFSGPFILCCLYIALAIHSGEPRYLVGVGLCYVIAAVMVARFMEVLPLRPGRH